MYFTVIKYDANLRTLEKCRKHSPAVRVFYVFFVFSNARRILSQCNARLRLLYLLSRQSSVIQDLFLGFGRVHVIALTMTHRDGCLSLLLEVYCISLMFLFA